MLKKSLVELILKLFAIHKLKELFNEIEKKLRFTAFLVKIIIKSQRGLVSWFWFV